MRLITIIVSSLLLLAAFTVSAEWHEEQINDLTLYRTDSNNDGTVSEFIRPKSNTDVIPKMYFTCEKNESLLFLTFDSIEGGFPELYKDIAWFRTETTEMFTIQRNYMLSGSTITLQMQNVPELIAAMMDSDTLHIRAQIEGTDNIDKEFIQTKIDIEGFDKTYAEGCEDMPFYTNYEMFLPSTE